MKPTKTARIALLVAFLVGAAIPAAPVLAVPATQDNLLSNPGFEGSLSGWETWAITSAGAATGEMCNDLTVPTFQVSSSVVHSGSSAAYYFTQWSAHNAGLFQVVDNVTPGATYRFTIWARASSRAEGETASSSFTKMRIGIDPNGGTDASAASIVWSGDITPMDSYASLTVEARAAGNRITVYTRSRPDWCMDHNDVYWDDASLVLVGGSAGTPTTPQVAQPSGTLVQNSVTATPDATGRVVHTVQPGDTLSQIAFIYGVSVDEIKQLNNLTSDIVILGSNLIIRPGNQAAAPTPAAEAPQATEEAAAAEAATEQPSETPTPEPTEATAVAEVPEQQMEEEEAGGGSICVMSYDDVNGNGIREAEEPKLAGITFVLNDGTEMIGRYTTDGVSEPYCFAELAAGAYVVSWTGDNFKATNDQTWAINVEPGSILNHEFGAQPLNRSGDEGAGAGPGEGGLPPWVIALGAALGVIVLLGGIGALGYFLVIRRQEI